MLRGCGGFTSRVSVLHTTHIPNTQHTYLTHTPHIIPKSHPENIPAGYFVRYVGHDDSIKNIPSCPSGEGPLRQREGCGVRGVGW